MLNHCASGAQAQPFSGTPGQPQASTPYPDTCSAPVFCCVQPHLTGKVYAPRLEIAHCVSDPKNGLFGFFFLNASNM